MGCEVQDPERSNGVLQKDVWGEGVTVQGERVTKCLPKSLLTARGGAHKQFCIPRKHLHYKSS